MYINKTTHKQTMIYSYNDMLLSDYKEQTIDKKQQSKWTQKLYIKV